MRPFANIIDFTESPEGLNLRLFPTQKFILKSMYGVPLDAAEQTIKVGDWDDPSDLVTERVYNQRLYHEGRISAGDHSLHGGDAVISIGRRSGKTLLICIILLWGLHQLLSKGNPHKHFGMSEYTVLQLIVVGCDRSQADLIRGQARELMLQNDLFRPFLRDENAIGMMFATPSLIEQGGERTNVKVSFRSAEVKGMRGATNYLVILDEADHFSYPEEVYQATEPSVRCFSQKDPELGRISVGPLEGRVVMISSPRPKSGFFEKMFQLAVRADTSHRIFAYQAPTWEVNPTIPKEVFTEWLLAQELETFLCEFGGQFVSKHRSWEALRTLRDVLTEVPGISPADREHVLQEMRRRLQGVR